MAKFALGSPTSIPSGSADLPNLLASLGILVGTRTATLPGELECLRGRFRLNREEEESLLTALDPILVTLGLVEPLLRRDLLQLRGAWPPVKSTWRVSAASMFMTMMRVAMS
jgi:hypothetical protein